MKLQEKGNVYVLTNPLVDGDKECEIECLFSKEVLGHRINGKEFSRKDKYDTEKCYGKEIFSQYISSNYEKIDFSGFRPLLNVLNFVVASYSDQKN